MRMKRRLILSALLSFLAGPALAAPAATPSSYDVEVVVFENRLPVLEGGELWPKENLHGLISDIAGAADAEAAPGDAGLATAVKALQQSKDHHVLAHYRWNQSAEARNAVRPVRLRSGDATLDGVMRFYLSRFLHVELNLVLASGEGDWKSEKFAGQLYRMNEHRRVKTQEINYFDHPRLGVLVRVTPAGKP
jgi:hypothetical protein